MLPFTNQEFYSVFVIYNEGVWPAQLAAYAFGLIAFALIFVRNPPADRISVFILAGMWLWTGVAYHMIFFAAINPVASGFGAIFIVQGTLFLLYGTVWKSPDFTFRGDVNGWIGIGFILYSVILYPLIGWWAGHAYPQMPVFGITPCPVTIFTFGMMLVAAPTFSCWIMIVPLVWSFIGGSAAFLLGVIQDWPLLFSGSIAIALVEYGRRHASA